MYGCCIHPAQRSNTQRERDDMTTTTTEFGAYLARLREKAGFKQNELAQKVTWSPAVLSRVESGERALSPEERDSILEAIGTEDALGFKETAGRVWLHLPRPSFGHPDEQILWEAEQAIRSVKELVDSPDIKNGMAKRLEEFLLRINGTATPVLKTEHNVVFVGKIGVGKTTALCRMAGLEVLKGDRPEPVLEVGAGGTTVCEVRLQQGSGYGLHVEPMDTDDFHREVLEFANFLTRPSEEESPEQSEGDQDAHGTSKEIERVIRNMSGLTVIRKRLPDGNRERIDQAKKLAEEHNDPSTLAGEILALIRPQQRTRHQIWYPELSGQEPLVWLKETFEQLNNGRHPEFSLPKRIDIIVSQTILSEGPLSVCLVDTKGIDATAERADLEAYCNEPGTLMILCSSFNDTPSTEVQELLSRAKDARFTGLGVKAAILSLPRSDEALAVKDDQGISAESVAEGYELKGEQAELRLKSQSLPYAAIEFFNAREDNPQDLTDFLLQRVEAIRQEQCVRLKETISGAIELVENIDEAYVQESYQRVARRIRLWLEDNREIDWLPGRLEDSLTAAISRAHPASVNASVRREGNWHNPDYLHQLTHGARVIVARSVVPKQDDFESISKDIFRDEELVPAFGLVRQACSILEDGINSLLARSESLGERIYIQDLKPDAQFWVQCRRQWGLGFLGGRTYRERVCQYNRNWFSDNDRDFQAAVQQLAEREWRQISERLAAILDPEATEAIAA